MKKHILKLVFATSLLLSMLNCRKDNGPETGPMDFSDRLLPEELSLLDQLVEPGGISLSDILLPNGFTADKYLQATDSAFYAAWVRSGQCATPQECKSILVSKMMAVALALTYRSQFVYPSQGDNKPAQNGLAYSFGSKNHEIRQKPPAGSCLEEVYGLDCSGFIYQVFKSSGLNLPVGPANLQRDTQTLRKSVLSAFMGWESQLRVRDLGQLPADKMESGDIIYWKRSDGVAFHIGLLLRTPPGSLAVFQSNGSDGSGGAADCAKNYGPNRGPRLLGLTDPYWFGSGKPYGVVRLDVRDWDTYIATAGWVPSLLDRDPFVQDANGIKWLGTGDGLVRFDGQNYTVFDAANSSLPDNLIHQLEIDANDNLWIVTKKGLSSFNGNTWNHYNKDNSNMPTNNVDAIAVKPGGLWVGLSDVGVSGLYSFESGQFTAVPDPPGITTYSVNQIHVDGSGIWIDSFDDLMHFNGNSWVKYSYSSLGLDTDSPSTQIFSDNDGSLWFGTFQHGLCHFTSGSLSSYTPANSNVPGTTIMALLIDRSGGFWINYQEEMPGGGVVAGLAHRSISNLWQVYNPWNGYPFLGFTGILEDEENNIWTASVTGISVLYR